MGKRIEKIEDALDSVRKDRGVIIRILTRRAKAKIESSHKKSMRRLSESGFLIETEDLSHAKMLIVDGNELYIGLANLVETTASRNLEVGICTSDPATVRDAAVYFENKYEKARSSRFDASS
ncbi:MAG: phospholipase D-like domain-containing protein [Promethearchaeia archaeon]